MADGQQTASEFEEPGRPSGQRTALPSVPLWLRRALAPRLQGHVSRQARVGISGRWQQWDKGVLIPPEVQSAST
jgi:hypothetical protein